MRLTVSGDAATRRSYGRLSLTTATFMDRMFPNGRDEWQGRKNRRTMPCGLRFVKSEPDDLPALPPSSALVIGCSCRQPRSATECGQIRPSRAGTPAKSIVYERGRACRE